MMKRTVAANFVAGFAGLLLGAGTTLAAPTKSVRVTTYAEFAEGQVNGVLLSSLGEARAGFAATRLALPALGDDSVRAMAAAAGGSVYLGTGGESPAVLVYGAGGLRRLAKLDGGAFISALCLFDEGRPGGQVLAGTAADGRLYRIGPDGKSEVVAKLPAEHVWALLRDPTRGVTYAATGPGALWAIADGDLVTGGRPNAARKLFDSEARQLLALDRGEDGALYVGTADDAVLYRIEPNGGTGSVRAVNDFAGNEVRAIAHFRDTLYVAVNDMQRGDSGRGGTKMTLPAAGSAPGVKPAPPSGVTAPSSPSPVDKKGKGALYRIDPSGRVEQLHAVADAFFNALAVDGEGNLFAAASMPGGRGRVYMVTAARPLPTVYTVLEVKESDALTLALPRGPGGKRLVGTGNSGALYVLGDAPPADASYTSKAYFAGAPSRWGRLRYQSQGSPRLETRSGNLAKPDASWSPWQPLTGVVRQPVTDEQAGSIVSPPGRYLQVRALFPAAAVLRDLTFYYQPVNQRPRPTDILIGEDPSGRVARGVRPTATRPRTAVVKLRFKVENPDEDELSYRVFVRRLGEGLGRIEPLSGGAATGTVADAQPGGGWLRLGGPEPLVRPELDWNTETVADGLYELKVVVTDERSNPPELALAGELVSPPFLVDNRRPELRDLRFVAATGTLSGRAVDATSPLAELSYSIDGGESYPIAPRDGVLDDLSEDFAVRPPRPALGPGLHTVLVRAVDLADNVATAQLLIEIPTDRK